MYYPLAASSYIKLQKELDHPRKRLFNIQNVNDNESFKWSLDRYLNPADRNPARITKADKDFAKKVDFRDKKFPVKIRDIHENEKKNSIAISVFGYENKGNIQSMYHKEMLRRQACWLLIGEEGKKHCILTKDFNTFMHDLTWHRIGKHFCCYCLPAFSTEEILKRFIKDFFKIHGKQRIIMPKKGEYVKSKIMREK